MASWSLLHSRMQNGWGAADPFALYRHWLWIAGVCGLDTGADITIGSLPGIPWCRPSGFATLPVW